MTTKKNNSQILKETGTFDLLSALLNVRFGKQFEVYNKALVEILIKGSTINEASVNLQLTTKRFTKVFEDAVKQLKKDLSQVEPKFEAVTLLLAEHKKALQKIDDLEKVLNARASIPAELKPKFDVSVYDAGFTKRVLSVCEHEDIRTIGELVTMRRSAFVKFRNCGEKSADEVEVYLKNIGLIWDMQF
ncbi:MAG: hypothetical protein H0U95_09210 [Bacteroidetes bacterium]|nr:hypothetical protein [Bacteroidota bacterium]